MRYLSTFLRLRFTPKSHTCLLLFFISIGPAQAGQQANSWAWRSAAASSIILFYATNIMGADRMTLELGHGENVNVERIGAQWDWKNNLLNVLGFNLETYWQLDYSIWQSTLGSSQYDANNTLGLTPVFRFTRKLEKVKIYLDTSIGIYLYSSTQINDSNFGVNFQFSDALALGIFLGEQDQWSVAYKIQHLSNNEIQQPNNGINFNFLVIAYEYQ